MGLALSSYQRALDQLFARTTGVWKFGLQSTRALLRALGDPHDGIPFLHVGGTNGKGSVVATLDALLRAHGARVGRYTSPHLVDFTERIVVDGRPIDAEAVAEFVDRWLPTIQQLGATFFEATTCLALDYFARAGVDVAVIEVGLGGRLDSTNVIMPRVAGVTSIAIDHVQYLGDTLEQIAVEKAGIFKSGVPAVIGEAAAPVRAQLASLARTAGARPVYLVAERTCLEEIEVAATGTHFLLVDGAGRRRLHTPLVGRHQASNTAVALTMLEAAGGSFAAAAARAAESLARVSLPGRFHRHGSFLFDVAHNPDGAAVLAETLDLVSPPRPIVALVSVLRDKDWRRMLEYLAPRLDHLILTTPPSVPADRAWELSTALAHASGAGWSAEAVPDFDEAISRAAKNAATVLITGSFHTVGDAMARLQVSALAG